MRHPTVAAAILAFAVSSFSPSQQALAQELEPITAADISDGFWTLIEREPETVGYPIEDEHPGNADESTLVLTTTGALYWQPGLNASWTNGHDRLSFDSRGAPIRWQGDELAPPQPIAAPVALGLGALMGRVSCIEARESQGHNVWNRLGSGAGGVMQYMLGTFLAHIREMSHALGRPDILGWSLWNPDQARAVAAWDLSRGRRGQWTVGGC
jgi:hypothetical protein